MFSQEDIDAVLRDAEAAVDSLAEQTGLSATTVPGAAAAAAATTGVESSPSPDASRSERLRRILEMRVPVIVQLAERVLPLCDVIKLAPGSIIEFDRTVNAELDLLVNNRHIGSGEAIKVGEHFGLRVTGIGADGSRLQSADPV